jgi:hypothetical protein
MTIGIAAKTLLSTAPTVHVVQPRFISKNGLNFKYFQTFNFDISFFFTLDAPATMNFSTPPFPIF